MTYAKRMLSILLILCVLSNRNCMENRRNRRGRQRYH